MPFDIHGVRRRRFSAGDGAGNAHEPVPSGTIAPDRLRHVLARLADGFYDNGEVRDRILSRVMAELI